MVAPGIVFVFGYFGCTIVDGYNVAKEVFAVSVGCAIVYKANNALAVVQLYFTLLLYTCQDGL